MLPTQSDLDIPSHRTWWLWVAVAACAFHIIDEYAFNWPAWANRIHVPCNWTDYFVVNGAFLVLGISGAMVGWRFVVFALAFPALLFYNALFHLVVSLWAQQMNPGAITGLTILAPAGLVCYFAAYRDGVLTRGRLVGGLTAGAVAHVFPVLIILLRPRMSY